MKNMSSFKIDGVVHYRVNGNIAFEIEGKPEAIEACVGVSLDLARERKIPRDSQFLVFVTVVNGKVSAVEEVALGSERSVSILTDKERGLVSDFVLEQIQTK